MSITDEILQEVSKEHRMENFILNNFFRPVEDFIFKNRDLSDDMALVAVSVCRRRFRRDEIILMIALDEDMEGESGIVFTKNKIFVWEEGENYKGDVAYTDIENVNYDENALILCKSTGEELLIECDCGEANFNRGMYNFLMDIIEHAKSIKEN